MKARIKKSKGAAHNIVVGYLIAVCIILAGMCVITLLAIKDTIGEIGIEVSIAAIVAMSTIIGGIACKQNIKSIYALVVGVLLIITMLIGGMLTDGQFENLLLRIAVVLLSGIVSYIICIKNTLKTRQRKLHYR